MTRELDDWGSQSEEQRAHTVAHNTLTLMEQAARRPDFPPELSQYFPAFRESVRILPTPLFTQEILAFYSRQYHPAVIPGIMQRYERSPRHSLVLHQYPATSQVIVDQRYLGSVDGWYMAPELLAGEWGHIATTVDKKIPVASVHSDSWKLQTYKIGMDQLREIKNLPTHYPPLLLVQGFKSTLADQHYEYLTLPGTFVFEAIRAQLIGKYITAAMIGTRFQKTTTEALVDVERYAQVFSAHKDVLLMKLGKFLKWKSVISACVNDDIDGFFTFAANQMGLKPFKNLMDQLVDLELE